MYRLVFPTVLMLFAAACATTKSPELTRMSPEPEMSWSGPAGALARLRGPDGPANFDMVDPQLYRGGQPTAEHLGALRELGVTKIVDLRRERLSVRWSERSVARELGMQFVELPFFGPFGAEPEFLTRVVSELTDAGGGAVYVHCDDGRDRTSLAVALHRVEVDGWDPDRAWQREAIAYGFEQRRSSREIELAFRDHVLDHAMRNDSALAAVERTRAVAEIDTGLQHIGAVAREQPGASLASK
jgi:protein tyrosine/serine phosphatase